ncbi:MAG: hypothetical protein ABW208_09795 [Pyrinomonadaceae bacterium]
MISVKCPACGLVDWNVGNCKRCDTPLAGLEPPDGHMYAPGEQQAEARSLRAARTVVTACVVVVLGLTAVGALYLAHRPAKKQWFWSFYRHEPTVAEIFAHNMEVGGGAERFAKLRSFRAEGRLNFVGGEAASAAAAAGGQVTYVMHVKAPNKTEIEIEMGAAKSSAPPLGAQPPSPSDHLQPSAPQVTVSLRRGFDGSRGWEYVERTILTPGSTVPIKQHTSRELDGDALERVKRSAEATGVVRLNDRYTSLKLTGREPVTWAAGGGMSFDGLELPDMTLRGHEAYVVSGVNKDGKNETLYFDTETGLLLRVEFEAEDAEGELLKVECVFGDYKEVGGLKLPHRLHFKRGEESMTMTFEKYFPNEPIPDSTFEPTEPTE